MNRYKRALILSIILLMTGFFIMPQVWQRSQAWIKQYQTGGKQTLSGSLSSSLVYPVTTDQWISFNIPEGSQQLRVVSNAHIQKPDNITLEDSWKYILHYQLLDKDGNIIKDELYHHRTKLSTYRDEQGELLFGNFYSGYPLTPLDGRLMLLSMSAIQQAKSMRISFVQQSHEVEEAAIRLYVPAKLSEHRLAAMWLRMSKKNKEALAKNSAYPASLLSETEKRNLLKHQWQPQGPSGIEGLDYAAKTLYILRELEQEKISEVMIAAGLQIEATYPGIIAIPEQGGELTLHLSALDGSALSEPVTLQLQWFGRRRSQRWQREERWLPDAEESNFSVEGGLLEIKSRESVLVRAFLNTENQQRFEITPNPLMITAYMAAKGVDYQVLHVDNQPTPMRVDIRRIYQNSTDQTAALQYQWFNSQHQLIESGNMPVNDRLSNYDRLTSKQKDLKVSDPLRYFFNVPATVTQVRLISEQNDLLVNVYNQPYQYQKTQRVPENAYVSIDKKNWFPTWFQMRAENEQSLLKQQAVSKIAAQYRPPEDSPALLSDQYFWEDYRPLEQAEARHILTAMDNPDYRDEALASVYCEIQPNSINRLHLKAYGNLTQISPQLVSIRPQNNAFHLTVDIDQKPVIDTSTIGQQGIFRLANISSGQHAVKVATPDAQSDGQWLMNYVSGCTSKTYLKRRVFKISNRELTFTYTNDQLSDKVFSGRFYAEADNSERSVLQVSIEPMQKQTPQKVKHDWTFTRRSYDIRPAKGQPSIVLHSHGHFLNSGESFFIPFKRDMPIGQYQIKIKLKQGTPGYLGLSLVSPGAYEQQRFYRETNDQIH